MKKCSNEMFYYDITNKWLKSKNKSNSLKIYQAGEIFKYKGKKYLVDDRYVLNDFKKGEKEFALWLLSITNKSIEMLPRFNKPEGLKSPDFKVDKKYFDYKHTSGNSSQLILHNIQKSQKQSTNFFINITNLYLDQKMILEQINDVFRRIKWVEIIGVKSKYGFKIYKKEVAVVNIRSPRPLLL